MTCNLAPAAVFIARLVWFVGGLGCVAAAAQSGRPRTQPEATFYEHIEPILRQHCRGCHTPGEIGPMPLVSYKDVRPWAAAIRESVRLRRMPPWFADPNHGEFLNDPRLS